MTLKPDWQISSLPASITYSTWFRMDNSCWILTRPKRLGHCKTQCQTMVAQLCNNRPTKCTSEACSSLTETIQLPHAAAHYPCKTKTSTTRWQSRNTSPTQVKMSTCQAQTITTMLKSECKMARPLTRSCQTWITWEVRPNVTISPTDSRTQPKKRQRS